MSNPVNSTSAATCRQRPRLMNTSSSGSRLHFFGSHGGGVPPFRLQASHRLSAMAQSPRHMNLAFGLRVTSPHWDYQVLKEKGATNAKHPALNSNCPIAAIHPVVCSAADLIWGFTKAFASYTSSTYQNLFRVQNLVPSGILLFMASDSCVRPRRLRQAACLKLASSRKKPHRRSRTIAQAPLRRVQHQSNTPTP